MASNDDSPNFGHVIWAREIRPETDTVVVDMGEHGTFTYGQLTLSGYTYTADAPDDTPLEWHKERIKKAAALWKTQLQEAQEARDRLKWQVEKLRALENCFKRCRNEAVVAMGAFKGWDQKELQGDVQGDTQRLDEQVDNMEAHLREIMLETPADD
jgi:hypothetical protein